MDRTDINLRFDMLANSATKYLKAYLEEKNKSMRKATLGLFKKPFNANERWHTFKADAAPQLEEANFLRLANSAFPKDDKRISDFLLAAKAVNQLNQGNTQEKISAIQELATLIQSKNMAGSNILRKALSNILGAAKENLTHLIKQSKDQAISDKEINDFENQKRELTTLQNTAKNIEAKLNKTQIVPRNAGEKTEPTVNHGNMKPKLQVAHGAFMAKHNLQGDERKKIQGDLKETTQKIDEFNTKRDSNEKLSAWDKLSSKEQIYKDDFKNFSTLKTNEKASAVHAAADYFRDLVQFLESNALLNPEVTAKAPSLGYSSQSE